ncbi:MAG: hypothetical protein R3D00_27545 [Bacteroidia bacterium]
MKPFLISYFVLIVIGGIFFTSCGKEAVCIDTNCANYTSQAAAQAAYEADPECRGDLDADKDGIACEEPGNSVKNCGSTSNCGCSGYRKDECPTNPCCQWIVGDGCKCK